jgi:putative membrane protein
VGITRRRFLVNSTTAGLALALVPYLALADDDDDHRRNNITDEPGEGSSQAEQNRQSNNGNPPSEQVTTYQAEQDWIFTAASGHKTEVMAGQLAIDHGQSQDVKKFGRQMIDDHTKWYDALTRVADNYGVEMPQAPATDDHKSLIQALTGLSGSGFDNFYARAMLQAHRNDVGAYQDGIKLDDRVARYANKYLDNIREHLGMAEDLARKLGIDPSTV